MAEDLRPIPLEFWKSPTGREPTRDWFRDLPDTDRLVVGTDLRRVQFGWPIGMPLVKALAPNILVDARMRKREKAESQRGLANLTIGLGPSFVAGETTDVLIETRWGDRLGQVLTEGASLPFAGEPRRLGGHGRDRYVYAPAQGPFRTKLEIGDPVKRGDVVAHIGSIALPSPLDGVLRGLTRDGVPVSEGTKVIEVDPRGADAEVTGIGERPRRIAESVSLVVRDVVPVDPRGPNGK